MAIGNSGLAALIRVGGIFGGALGLGLLLSQSVGQNAALSQDGFSNQVRIEVRDGYRYIYSNGIPNHATGDFPNAGNPNRISAQEHTYRVPLNPQLTDTVTPVMPAFGVALNGVPFEPGTGEFWQRDRSSGWRYEALTGFINLGTDMHNAHVQPTGSYHYHGVPTGLVQAGVMTQLGYAADGFPVYGPHGYANASDAGSELVHMHSSYRLKTGQRPDGPGGDYDGTFLQDFEYVAGLGDLDECNGRVGVTPDHPEGIYHYYITERFPFIPRCVRGTPDESFRARGGGPGGPGNGPPNGPRNGRPPGPPDSRPSGSRPSGSRPPEGRPPGNRPPRPADGGYPPPYLAE